MYIFHFEYFLLCLCLWSLGWKFYVQSVLRFQKYCSIFLNKNNIEDTEKSKYRMHSLLVLLSFIKLNVLYINCFLQFCYSYENSCTKRAFNLKLYNVIIINIKMYMIKVSTLFSDKIILI